MGAYIKVLILTSGNYTLSPYVEEQVTRLKQSGIIIDYYFIVGHNSLGYLNNLPKLKKKIREFTPDLIHAHYSLSGLLAYLTGFKPILVTYHGSDVNDSRHRKFSRIISFLTTHNIFVEESLAKKIKIRKNYSIIPCGVNTHEFFPLEMSKAREILNIDYNDKIILFSSSFDRKVKNYQLARDAINGLGFDAKLVELKDLTRKEVMLFINAADVCILTSFYEGSPQFIKEVMACNSPAVSTDVGDVRRIFGNLSGYYISDYNPENVISNIKRAINFRKLNQFTQGRDRIINLGLSNDDISDNILEVYNLIHNKNSSNIIFQFDKS